MISGNSTMAARAGRNVSQPAGYRAFIPKPLPPDPPVDLGGRLREDARARIADRMGRAAANGHRILDRLFGQPIADCVTSRMASALRGEEGANQPEVKDGRAAH